MKLSDEEMLWNMCHLMDLANIPHNCNGDDLIEIDKRHKIKINKSTIPWRCTLVIDDKEVYSSNPTGIIIVLKSRLAYEKHFKNKLRKMKNV